MSINETRYPRRSNLTKEQKREAEAAIYGLSTKPMEFNHDEIERMRAMIAQHDAQQAKQGIQEFDLNNPPKQPYRFQEFPKLVYDHETRAHKAVHSKEQERLAIEQGYQLEPYPSEVPEPDELDPETAAEVERLDKIARKKKQKPSQE